MIHGLIAEYGMAALGFPVAALTAGLTRYVFVLISSKIIGDAIARLWHETRMAVLEVGQTYTDALKEASADGKLTGAEKYEAKAKAIAIAKSNFGKKGLLRLSRVLDVDEWLGNKVEAFVREEQTKKPKA